MPFPLRISIYWRVYFQSLTLPSLHTQIPLNLSLSTSIHTTFQKLFSSMDQRLKNSFALLEDYEGNDAVTLLARLSKKAKVSPPQQVEEPAVPASLPLKKPLPPSYSVSGEKGRKRAGRRRSGRNGKGGEEKESEKREILAGAEKGHAVHGDGNSAARAHGCASFRNFLVLSVTLLVLSSIWWN